MSHAITVTRAGYAPWTREIFAEAAKESAIDARLAALLVEVRVQGEPADAEVFVNGASRGKAPASMSLPASRQHIEVRKEGFNAFVTDLVLAPGIARTVEFKLVNPKDVAGNSPQTIRTKSGIKLLIVAGGVFQAGTDRREQGRRPNEGAHKVTLLRPFYMGEREVTNAQFRQFQRHAQLRFRGPAFTRSRQTTRVARHLGRSRRILQLAVGAGRPASGVPAAGWWWLRADAAGEQWLPAAD